MVIVPAYDWQLEMFEAMQNPDIEEIAAVGSRGPGKSWMARNANVIRALSMPNTHHIIFRRTSDDIVKQYVPEMKKLLDDFHGVKVPYGYNQTYKYFTVGCPNGGNSWIYLAFAESLKHAEKYMGFEYATATFDEVTHFEEAIPQLITGSVRGVPNIKKLYFGNPGGIGHAWSKRKFITEARDNPKLRVWRPLLKDNVELQKRDPSYGDRLTRGLPEWKKRQWLDGDWDANDGQYFSLPPAAIRSIEPPYWAKWYAGVDGGYFPSAFAVVWIATWRDLRTGAHRCHIYRCLKQQRLNLDKQAQAALEIEELYLPQRPVIRWADPATGKKNETESDETARTTARTWARHGFLTTAAQRHSRVAGWMLFREMLTPIPYDPRFGGSYGVPGEEHGILTIDPSCRAVIDEIVDAQFERVGGTVSGDDLTGEDHTLDAIRYVLRMVYGLAFAQAIQSAYVKRPTPLH